MQMLDLLSTLEAQISALLLHVRDANSSSRSSGGAAIKVEDLLPPLLRVSRALRQHKTARPQLQITQTGKFPIEDFTRDLGRALTDASSESLLSVPVVHQGWVRRAEWGAFWRNERREYACLCDDGVLRFFSGERQCSEYLFALARVRSGSSNGACSVGGGGAPTASEETTASRSLKEHAPQSQIDLSDTVSDWSVRKGDSVPSERHAFALFEHRAKLRLIVDVESSDEVDAWLAAINSELRQTELLAGLKREFGAITSAGVAPAPARQEEQDASESAASLLQRISSSVASTDDSESSDGSELTEGATTSRCTTQQRRTRSFRLPLRWLHAQTERLHGHSARHQRLQSSSLSQALKDFRRDRITINGLEHPGACVDHVLLALTTSILRMLSSPMRTAGSTVSLRPGVLQQSSISRLRSTAEPLEMIAIQLAKELLVCSSRTVGGGDVLDALHLVFPSSHFSVCPKSSESEPIAVRVSSDALPRGSSAFDLTDPATPVAEITIRMRYCVLPSATTESGESPLQVAEDSNKAERRLTPVDVVGIYYRRLVGDFVKWHEVDGHVHLECLH